MASYQYIDSTGVIVADTSDILTEVQNEFKAAFGDDISVDPSTPQGVLIAAEVAARKSVINNNAALANQINPNISGGVFLDAIWALMGGERTVATRSTVTATLSGVAGSIIPEGVQAKTTGGDYFELTAQTTIGTDGTVSATFQSVEYGAIACPAAALTQIVDTVIGWESITNAAEPTIGTSTQGDMSARRARRNTLAKQGATIPEAVTSAVYEVEGVTSLSFRENKSSATATIDGVSMEPHSVYLCVNGGTDSGVAAALLNSCSAGAGFNGSTSVTVTESSSGQDYEVLFDRATEIPILCNVTVKTKNATDPQTTVKEAILSYASGELDSNGMWGVGDDANPWELAGAINQVDSSIYVSTVELKKSTDTSYSTSIIGIDIWEIATITASSINVTVVSV